MHGEHCCCRRNWRSDWSPKEISPPAGQKIPFFFTKMLYKVQHFCEKEKTKYHAAAGASGFPLVKRPV
jgi:hypothetical protein